MQNIHTPVFNENNYNFACDRFVRIQAENGWKVSEDCYLIDEDESEVGPLFL